MTAFALRVTWRSDLVAFGGRSGHGVDTANRSFMTHSVTFRALFAAMREDHSIISLARVRQTECKIRRRNSTRFVCFRSGFRRIITASSNTGQREPFIQASYTLPLFMDINMTNGFLRHHLIRALLLLLAFATIGAKEEAQAQNFPTGVIRIIAPVSVSTPPDILARIVANALSDSEGWKVVVENKPGGVMSIGAMDVLKQPADGQTIFSVSAPVAAAPALLPTAPFNYETDFAPLIRVGTGYNVLVVNPTVPVNTVSELVAYLKKDPGKHTFSSGGFGTPAHLIGEMFKLQTGVDATHVPYNQFPQAIADLVAGLNTYQFITILPVVQLIKTGKLRALAVTGTKRVAALPDVPTIAEAGYPKLTSEDWAGFLLKVGTPPEVTTRLNAAINKALGTEKVRDALVKLGVDPGGGTPEEFGVTLHSEIARWGKIVQEAGIKIQQ
jgi:tripartite-type tricarboxylate transporter receptor subunit TctC